MLLEAFTRLVALTVTGMFSEIHGQKASCMWPCKLIFVASGRLDNQQNRCWLQQSCKLSRQLQQDQQHG